MSIDLSAHLGISRGNLDPDRLIGELDAGCPAVRRLIADWVHPHLKLPLPHPPIRWQHHSGPRPDGDLFSLYVPAGNCALSVQPRRARFWVGVKWGNIWYSPPFQDFLRWACSDLAQLLGSSVAIYMPEVVLPEGDNLDEALRNLRRDHGDPAPTLAALESADQPDLWSAAGCYYIDTFAGMPSPPPPVSPSR